MSAELYELKPEELHQYWAFLARGMTAIKRKLKPNWIPEDMYAALRSAAVSCVIARRNERLLGFLIYSKQIRPFNFAPELFVWVAWNLPVREWLPDDNMQSAILAVLQYIAKVAKSQYQTDQISWITRPSRAKAFARKYGWGQDWVTMTVRV